MLRKIRAQTVDKTSDNRVVEFATHPGGIRAGDRATLSEMSDHKIAISGFSANKLATNCTRRYRYLHGHVRELATPRSSFCLSYVTVKSAPNLFGMAGLLR